MTEWIIRRWRRYGHDRLYAATPGGTDLGYLDLSTGRYYTDDLSNLPLLRKAIEDHRAAHRASMGTPESVSPTRLEGTPEPAVPSQPPTQAPARMASAPTSSPPSPAHSPRQAPAAAPEPPPGPWLPGSVTPGGGGWHDLADARAGAAARERALAERQAQGVLRHTFARVLDAKTDERAWRLGADGEEAVGRQLATLGLNWRVLHAVPVGERGSDIDHVVIGPGGVFTINTKHHPKAAIWVGGDTFMVNGQRVPYIRNSRFEAGRASRLLSEHVGFPVPVMGLIAVVGARRGFTVKSQPGDGGVRVIGRRGVRRVLESQPVRLGLREIDAIHEVARRSSTWQR